MSSLEQPELSAASSSDANVELLEVPTTEVQSLTAMARKWVGKWWLTFSLSSVCVVSGHLLIKAGLNAAAKAHFMATTPTGRILHILTQPEVVIGLMIYMFGTACWMAAVSQKEISFLYPLSSVNYVLVVVASATLFLETISLRRGSGVMLIVVGMILLNRKSSRGERA